MSFDTTAVSVQNVSKLYQLYENPQDRLKQAVIPRLKRLFGADAKPYYHEFWALRDISFSVCKGETVGIIGRNGAGKSTLLQILCGTLSPSSGDVAISGRVAALLELGAGFNPEFTGRENVYMNGGVLGLSRQEIDNKFAAIERFADIGDFIDQPVKTYSSGMYVRLAFSVAVHVDPDILIIDEALSVGDFAFQNKCLMRIKELRERGTTLLFVSHDLSVLQMICERVMWIDKGRIVKIGNPVAVCQDYHAAGLSSADGDESAKTIMQHNTGMAEFVHLQVHGRESADKAEFCSGDPIQFSFAVKALVPLGTIVFAISIYRTDGDWIIGQTSREHSVCWPPLSAGEVASGRLLFESNLLAPGDYLAAVGAYSEDLSLCYGLSELTLAFSVRSGFPVWGKILHPAKWMHS